MSAALKSHIPASALKPPADHDLRTRYGLRPRYSLTEHHRQNLSHTSRKSILLEEKELKKKAKGVWGFYFFFSLFNLAIHAVNLIIHTAFQSALKILAS